MAGSVYADEKDERRGQAVHEKGFSGKLTEIPDRSVSPEKVKQQERPHDRDDARQAAWAGPEGSGVL
jgi:hypothetical protein